MPNQISGQPSPGKPKKVIKKKKILIDESIQGTNDSSIVSKRSVERLYSKKSPHPLEFFRYFVPKPQRRSPIINRGYWTRMEAMKSVINKVLVENQHLEGDGKVIIVNLGCGFDPYPFQYLSTGEYANAVFVDVDYSELIKKKATTIANTKELCDIIGDVIISPATASTPSPDGKIYLQTKQYIALGCDLRELNVFEKSLRALFDLERSVLLFTAEVSLTYMIQETADALIKWAATLPRSEFALLEQIMPGGEEHPFAKTMLKHFNSLKTPLHSISSYPNVELQRNRFLSRGWRSAKIQDLYDFWRTEISPSEKKFVQSVEDFDEWEEFILFGQHYFILHASGGTNLNQQTAGPESISLTSTPVGPNIYISRNSLPKTRRKFSAGCLFDESSILFHGGSTTVRENSSLIITTQGSSYTYNECPIPGRMCHTLSTLPSGDVLLVGGRLNPSKPLKDCWLLSKSTGKWSSGDDLPCPRYRHCSVAVGDKILVFGGCVEEETSPFIIWSAESGWKYVNIALPNLFSSCFVWDNKNNQGIIIGGMDSNHNISSTVFKISYDNKNFFGETLLDNSLLARYNSKAAYIDDSTILIAGGVSPSKLLDRNDMFISLDISTGKVSTCPIESEQLPMLIGFNLDTIKSNEGNHLISYNGGCICFSFGPFWDDVYTIGIGKPSPTILSIANTSKVDPTYTDTTDADTTNTLTIKQIQTIDTDKTPLTENDFQSIYKSNTPVLFKNNKFGSCLENWKSPDYLIEKAGAATKVTVHATNSSSLNFQTKNFQYQNLDFKEFIDRMFSSDGKVYLRSVSRDDPKSKPAFFKTDFPTLSQDFQLPDYLKHIQEQHFSSPLRLSSPNTSMWLHYDVTANVLCQITGTKRVRLYPPADVVHLSFPPGASSSTIENIFDNPPLSHNKTHPIETIMSPGDIIFIPATWLHATLPLQPSISLNFFWKDLAPSLYAAGKDIYGNRDISAYEDGRKAIAKLVDNFSDVPYSIRNFYLQRLADELKTLC